MSASASEVVRTIVGIVFRLSSFLISARTSRPSILGRFRSSKIKSGRGAWAWAPSCLRKAMASTPSEATCKWTDRFASWKASCVSRTSPGLSSTKRTSMGMPFLRYSQFARLWVRRQYTVLPPCEAKGRFPVPVRHQAVFGRISCRPLFWQFGVPQPEFVDVPNQGLKRVQLHGFVQVAVRLELIAFHDVHLGIRSGQDNRRNSFKA